MAVRLKSATDSIAARDLSPNELAVIVSHPTNEHIGELVQRFGFGLLPIGGGPSDVWDAGTIQDGRFRVRILKSGETLEVV